MRNRKVGSKGAPGIKRGLSNLVADMAFAAFAERAVSRSSRNPVYAGCTQQTILSDPMEVSHSSGDRRGVHLLLRFARDPLRGWQLEYRRPLAFAQTGDQHDLPVGEFQGVVMHVRAVHIDPPESSDLISKLTELHAWKHAAKRMVALHLALECHFGAGRRHTATFGSPMAANPRVRKSNFVVTSLSPTFAGRDATL